MSIARKTTAAAGFTAASLGFTGFVVWLFGWLEPLLRAVDLTQVPPEVAAAVSALIAIIGGVTGLLALVGKKPAG